jgi:orotidine-5'-phosphate decarboxylase
MNRQQLIEAIKAKGSFLCVGLDTDPDKVPEHLKGSMEGLLTFNKAIIDATRPYAVAYKPNIAFYEAMGPAGWELLAETLKYIGSTHFTIADAKRGDIGNTSKKYAQTFFETYSFDAITVAPYMGRDSVDPFLAFEGKWAIVLALTSNRGADDFQFLKDKDDNQPLYAQVIKKVASWGSSANTMYVVGATRPEMLEEVRALVPQHFLLVPGVGAQGGSLQEVCQYGLNADIGLLVNASRSILYASANHDFAEAAAATAKKMVLEMKSILKENSLL